MNLSLTKSDAIVSALATGWGVGALLLGLAVLTLGLLSLVMGPRRLSVVSGAAIAVAGVIVIVVAQRAAVPMAGFFKPGLGIYIDVLAGILLVPTGFAVAVVGYILAAEASETTR